MSDEKIYFYKGNENIIAKNEKEAEGKVQAILNYLE